MKQISKEYAEAIFMLAKEENKENEYEKDLELIAEVFEQNPEYFEVLLSPNISAEEKETALEKAFSNEVCENVLSFLMLLLRRGRIRQISECVDEYKKMLEFSRNILNAVVKSAVPLTDEQKKAISEKLSKSTGKSVALDFRVDESLIGGIIIETDGKIIDGSIKTRLKDVKDVISK